MEVLFHPDAEKELEGLPTTEKNAVANAVEKLAALGDQLRYPHSSGVKGVRLRELRPRSGRSPWRAFYRRVENVMVIAAVGPEAEVDVRGFDAAVARAVDRLTDIEESE